VHPADIRALFPALHGTIYLNTASMCVGSAPARDAYLRALDRWSAGRFDWADAERAGEEARAAFAQLIGAQPDEIAIVPAVSAGAGLIAANMPQAQRGENIVVAGGEFASNYFPWVLLRERGYQIRTVESSDDGVAADAYGASADGGTRLIAVSAVHSSTGYRADVAAISRIAARSGALLFVDACQAAGAVPLDVVRDGVDVLATSSHKFLLGSKGMGYLFVRRQLLDRLRPVGPGWKAARMPLDSFYGPEMDLSPTASKLDTPLPWFAAMAEQASFDIFRRLGIPAILDRNARLARRLHDAVAAHYPGFRPFPEAHRSTILSVPVADAGATMARFRGAGVVASVRAGRVRLSVHFYNLDDEIDRAAKLLAGA
jgi:selenocysteine lyase/cysteine desulfurase